MCFPASRSCVVLQGKFTWRHPWKRDGPREVVVQGECGQPMKQNLGIWGFAGIKKTPAGSKIRWWRAKALGELRETLLRGASGALAGGEEGAMPPQRALASLGFVAPAALPLPSAAPGQDNPGAVTSHGSCSWAPPGNRCLGWGGTGGRRQVRDCPRSWLRSAGAVGGCSRGPRAHAQNPFGLFGQETGAANPISRVL